MAFTTLAIALGWTLFGIGWYVGEPPHSTYLFLASVILFAAAAVRSGVVVRHEVRKVKARKVKARS